MRKIIVSFVLFFIIAASAVVWWKVSVSAVNLADKTTQSFVISKGDGVKIIAKNLKDQGFIRDELVFSLLVKKLGIEKNIQAGSFKISKSMNATQIAIKFTLGTEDVWITIPEGWRSEQIMDYLKAQGIASGEANWKTDEGKYFPDTYLVPKQFSLDDARKLMRTTFDQKVPSITKNQLIIASLIEREAKNSTDRPLISSVIYNRLSAGMALDIDATILYALGTWEKVLTSDDLKIKSPYNTYTNPGLPPGPICNPGLASIEAAINPAKSDYLFYIHDKNLVAHFAKTIEEHNANVAKHL